MKTVSLLIPVYNEASFLPLLFQSIQQQDYPQAAIDIIAVDGHSTDTSFSLLKAYQQQIPKLTVLSNPRRSAPSSLNMAIQIAQGDYLIRMDSHTEYAPDYIRQCVAALDKTGADNVGGHIRIKATNRVAQAIALATTSLFGVGNSQFHYTDQEGYVDTVYLGAYRRQVFTTIGYYDENLIGAEDDELNYRLIKQGGKIYLTAAIQSYYYPRDSLKKLWRQYFQYGYGKFGVIRKHTLPTSIRHLIPALFVLSLLIGILSSFYHGLGLYLLLPVIVSYLFALTIFTLQTTYKTTLSLFGLVALVFITLHLSYGIGFLTASATQLSKHLRH
ncbi:glycosyltransferase family 2 protein [Beggiatoa leptomitoformis]|uniref:Glycosyltransferase n=1 Tax=Beggiatoa leptomitoformis TaxID=288004 RepID=A0A2N9YG39_9GAMM|nr:glycosyltransferase family 2 protein [Beggiatoa leptomitoformis]ALG68329.1 glycosyltransferase [Beggiatoa leptomitoformis]AUI69355.1 glycosyltransferase [Beggiatoa leptomitoformis]